MENWMDEVIDGKPLEAEWWKINYIESTLHLTAISTSEQSEIINSLDVLTDIDADKIIKKIKEYEIKTDCRDQYEEMRKNGMFRG